MSVQDNNPISSIRIDYRKAALDEANMLPDAIDQFNVWLQEALNAHVLEPTACTLATCDADNIPHARIVLLKGVDTGFVFYTNYKSAKGSQLAQRDKAAMVFFWPELERQVRIEGDVHKVTAQESDTYFYSRPASSQIGAAASEQSAVISSRDVLETRVAELTEQRNSDGLQRPDHWGGYRIVPTSIEFWQGRSSRLHDRLRYTKTDGSWMIERLSP